MKRRYIAAVAVCAVSSLLVAALPSPAAFADTTTPAEEAFRASLGTYLQNLQGALTAAAQNPRTSASIGPKLQDYQAGLAVASQQIPLLTGPQLDAGAGIVGQSPSWAQQPAILAQDLSTAPTTAPTTAHLKGYLSDCSTHTGSKAEQRTDLDGWFAAALVGTLANAVASGAPDGADFAPFLIIASVAYGVANALTIAAQADLSLSQDCAAAISNAALLATFPTDPSSSTSCTWGSPPTCPVIPASSQYSVDLLTTKSDGIKQTLNTIQTTTNTINSTLNNVINSFGIAQGTANTIQNIATDLQSRSDALLNSIGNANDQATDPPPSGSANGLANTINAREDTTLSSTGSFQALSLRAEIEAALAAPSGKPVALFALPASQGGYLASSKPTDVTVQSVVTTTINNMLAAGQSVGTAQTSLAAGNTALAANQFETAYFDYQAAYISAAT